MDDFRNAPFTVGELRSDKTESAGDWGPRDVLICLLRQIDSGQMDVTAMVCAYTANNDGMSAHYIASSPNIEHTLGMIETAKFRILRDASV